MSNLNLRAKPTPEFIADIRRRYPVERSIDEALTRKMMRRGGDPAPATDVAELERQLHGFLASRVEGPYAIRDFRALTGGASKEQFSFEMDWTCNGEVRTGERMVLRREPAESVAECDRAREFQLVHAVKDIVPVPPAYWLDANGDELGRPTLIYGFVDGVQKPPAGSSNVTGIGAEFDQAHRDVIGPQVIEYLGRIHNFDPSMTDADLSAFDIPQVGTTQDIDWQINWWARMWQEDNYEAVPLMTATEQWLRANRQPLDKVSLIHSDYRTGNYLFDPATKKVTAVLDWELGYFGDRHFDLAWILLPAFSTLDEHGKTLYSGIFRREKFIADYCEASGLTIDADRLAYYQVFAAWKGISMPLAAALRAAGGLKSHHDIVLSWFSGISYSLLESLRRALAEVTEVGRA